MATKSMLKNVDIREKNLGRNLVVALEKAIMHERKDQHTNIICEEVKKEKLKEIFG